MLTHKGTQLIATKRLILRAVRAEDVQSVFKNWASDDAVTKYLSWPTHTGEEITAMVVNEWISGYERPDFYQWGIDFNGQLIGSISVVRHDDQTKRAEMGYCIGKDWWHQGIMTEALNAVIDYLFNEVGMNRVEACHDPRNPNSGKVMMKSGMRYEGTLRQAGRNNQGICDVSVYSILAEER